MSINNEIPTQPPVPRPPKTAHQKQMAPHHCTIILHSAPLHIVKVGGSSAQSSKGKETTYQLLNSDDHQNILRKHGEDLSQWRPDIVHQCLLALLDSPLNKSGQLTVYIHTCKGVLIEVSPHCRIPRTYNRFAGLFAQLLQKLSVKAVGSQERLLNVVKGPVERLLGVGCVRIGLSGDVGDPEPIPAFIERIQRAEEESDERSSARTPKSAPTLKRPMAFYIGAIPHGSDNFGAMDHTLNISDYPLSAATVCSRLCHAHEQMLGIL